ncbi:hypothetical protein AYR62_04845 [Secundilactobacillus paracollinoides]|uniref:Universal stress protein n=1 Tax=Secundilactobacillus paracollinoides TaxID=240427 RepID=A0A1B2J0C8_9LACO|nr:universal stress protein [Secundilactobacillus paracollinoides]ANZ61842.1 hypothetical protein AYR61_11120 [Secundilactobacillus paracollinoides]ANZ63479.1 hypothetical protein AYR62_04845 [Secundilactobacillus paracollinoides]ANZ67761.1 hypothetical protein AYR63_11875 [Secundilactobacillus paracollinoides]
MYQHILVPLDGSANSNQALQEAIELSRVFGAKLTLLTVVNNSNWIAASGSIATDITKDYRERAERLLAQGRAITDKAGIQTTSVIKTGIPKNVIVDYCQSEDIDLIVIGKSGADAINRLLIGSTTAYVVRHATVRVLVVNAQEDPEA